MNFTLPGLPERMTKPRDKGLTMVMDKGLSLRQAADLVSAAAEFTDFIKLGFGTSLITNELAEKLHVYKEAGIKTFFGGTLFEAFLVRGMVDDYMRYLEKFGMEVVEVSDGSIHLEHDEKCKLIARLAKNYTVLSEVGSKEEGVIIHPGNWIALMNKEIEAGAWKVIAEARESGTVGIYRPNGNAHVALINKILQNVPADKIIWEAPRKSQQAWFIKLLGAQANLGNIPPEDIIPLETLRLGLRGDTFHTFFKAKA
ncbi:MAG: phosphosulfolactate synthase [Bacteroidia bacterium]|nr:phosphosulfolactate synthase [Bacteroidia bacterium]